MSEANAVKPKAENPFNWKLPSNIGGKTGQVLARDEFGNLSYRYMTEEEIKVQREIDRILGE
jgi:hypothetical protein